MQQRILAAVVVSAIGWGTGGVVSRVALGDGASPFEIALARGAIAGVGIVVFLALRRRLGKPLGVEVRVGAVMAVTNMAIPFVVSNFALQYASAGFVALPAALIPLMTALFAHVLLPDERLNAAKVLGLVVALAGVAVLLLSGDSGLADGGRPVLAGMLGLISVFAISLGSIYSKHHAGSYRLLQVSGIQFLLGSVLIAVASAAADGRVGIGPTAAWPELAYLAVMATLVPFLLFYWLIRYVTATYASIVGYIVPLIAVVTGVVFLDEQVQPGIVIGGLLIVAGVGITDRLERRRRRRAAR